LTAAQLLAAVEQRGVVLIPEGGRLRVRGVLDADLLDALRVQKPAILALLKQRDAMLPEITQVSLYPIDKVVEVAVPWADVTFFIAPGCRMAHQLAEQFGWGRGWCTCEILDLVVAAVRPADARKVGEAKVFMNGAVTSARRGDAQ
jgi:hypothetical protein